MSVKLSDYVLQRIVDAGVRHVFLVPGGGAMHLDDSLAGRAGEVAFVATLHEHAAAVAAEAYAKLTGNLGVALVTAGPGSTNCLTGLASAWVNSAPVLFVSGQVKTSDLKGTRGLRQLGLQEIDIVSAVRSMTKHAATVADPSTIRMHLDRALWAAREGRPGPVWLDIPLDVQAAEVDPAELPGFDPPPGAATDLSAQVAQVVRWLGEAERPVLLAGGGITVARATESLLRLADRLGIPVLTTWVGADLLPDDHPAYCGRPGAFASRGANFTVQNSDLLLSVGARWDFATTGFAPARFARAARRVVVDVDPGEIAKLGDVPASGIVADAGAFLEELERQLPAAAHKDRSEWLARAREWQRRYPVVTPDLRGRKEDVSTYVFMEALGRMLDEGDVIVEGSAGIQSEIFFLAFPTKRRQRIVCDGSLGAMGYGLPAAIGACVASGRRTVLIDGDGSFLPNIQELETVARLGLPLKMFIMNNRGYSSIRVSQQRWFGRLIAADATSGLTLPDLSRVAGAFGVKALRIGSEAALEDGLRDALSHAGPVLCDVNVPAEEDRVPRISNYRRADGSMASRPIEDLFPPLSREALRENMTIPLLED